MAKNGGTATIREVYDLVGKLRKDEDERHEAMDLRIEEWFAEVASLKTEIKGMKSFTAGVSIGVSTFWSIIVTVISIMIGFRKQ